MSPQWDSSKHQCYTAPSNTTSGLMTSMALKRKFGAIADHVKIATIINDLEGPNNQHLLLKVKSNKFTAGSATTSIASTLALKVRTIPQLSALGESRAEYKAYKADGTILQFPQSGFTMEVELNLTSEPTILPTTANMAVHIRLNGGGLKGPRSLLARFQVKPQCSVDYT
eukprot:4928125-Amphidinium_carterae.2